MHTFCYWVLDLFCVVSFFCSAKTTYLTRKLCNRLMHRDHFWVEVWGQGILEFQLRTSSTLASQMVLEIIPDRCEWSFTGNRKNYYTETKLKYSLYDATHNELFFLQILWLLGLCFFFSYRYYLFCRAYF